MRILIVNDDGIEAVGLRLLVEWAKNLGEVTVVAPKREQSSQSHAILLEREYEIKKVNYMDGVECYAVDSTPADCVRFGVRGLRRTYDLLLSGINDGVNIGSDLVYSGTVGGAFEGAKQGITSLAISAFAKREREAAHSLSRVYAYLQRKNLLTRKGIYNINIPPEPKGIRMTYQGSDYYEDGFEKVDGKEDYYRQAGKIIPDLCPNDSYRDTVALQRGYITVTPLLETRTDMKIFARYKKYEG